ncbi:MAG: glycine--tRNA ligase subunit beta [Candidatus Omnitrophica bacterium]|nr:glycine--tRNA ligase subunit beta [Candidatus Omnitrophota bacterium]
MKKKGEAKPQDFLLEIGCEELPADYLPTALGLDDPPTPTGLVFSANRVLSECGIKRGNIRCFGTPRRLVLTVEAVAPDVRREEKGPPEQVAFDAQGKPTRAAEAFAQRHGLKVSQLILKETPKGKGVFAEYSVPVTEVLSQAIPAIIGGIAFPKTMKWDSSGVRFARPIRWLVALYGPQVVPAKFGFIQTGRVSQGTRRSGAKAISVPSASAYLEVLEKAGITFQEGVTMSPPGPGSAFSYDQSRGSKRKEKRKDLLKQLTAKAQALKGRLQDQNTEEFEWLLNTVTFLAEHPVVESGSFLKEYLDLPAEVLATSMAKHLKLFSIREKNSEKLLPNFLAVLEGKPTNPAVVMANVERIIEARFTDARFFYREDTKTELEAKVSQLNSVVFHEKLGTVGQRIPRIERLIGVIGKGINLPPEAIHSAVRAARLCKADLVTQMVREFPTLQGLIGSRYAAHDAEPDAVVKAIREHYAPRTAKDPVPSTMPGALVSLADRLDALIGYFGVGLKPTGSYDQYGLRRQAIGLVRILVEPPKGVSFAGLSIDRLFDEGIQSWGSILTAEAAGLKKDLHSFLRERFEWWSFAQNGVGRELIEAVLESDADDLSGAWERLNVLRELWGDRSGKEELIKAAKVAERTSRIVKSVKGTNGFGSVDPNAFKEAIEKQLWDLFEELSPVLKEQVKQRRYREAVKTYSSLYPQIHQFFETVFVMDEDQNVRRNRLAMMREIHQSLAAGFADLSKLPLTGVEPSLSSHS